MKNEYFLINEVAEITGLSTQVIRKWESRYDIVRPGRLENGYRTYDAEDVHTLNQLKALREKGYSVQKAIRLIHEKREVALEDKETLRNSVEESDFVAEMLKSAETYDEAALTFLLKQAHHEFGLDLFLRNTVQPFLLEVGRLWETERWDESQEAISSLVIRDFLAQITRNFDHSDDAPLVIGCCLPAEKHEIPLQILLLRMKMKGWRTVFTGASPSFRSIRLLVERMKPQKVVLSASTRLPFETDVQIFEKLERIAKENPQVEFYLGGAGAAEYEIYLQSDWIHVGCDLKEILK